jgi:hypothetical protein
MRSGRLGLVAVPSSNPRTDSTSGKGRLDGEDIGIVSGPNELIVGHHASQVVFLAGGRIFCKAVGAPFHAPTGSGGEASGTKQPLHLAPESSDRNPHFASSSHLRPVPISFSLIPECRSHLGRLLVPYLRLHLLSNI